MTTKEIEKRDVDLTETALARVDEGRVLQYLGINPSDPRAQATVLIAQKYELDPLLKHVQLIQQGPYITRDGYLHIAHASGVFDGFELVEERETTTHYYATVAVYRRDISRPFTMRGKARKHSDERKPDPEDMAFTRALRRALKMAFDVAVPGATELGDDVDLWQPMDGDPLPAGPVLVLDESTTDPNETVAEYIVRKAKDDADEQAIAHVPPEVVAAAKPKSKRAPKPKSKAKPETVTPPPPAIDVDLRSAPLEAPDEPTGYKGVPGVQAAPAPAPNADEFAEPAPEVAAKSEAEAKAKLDRVFGSTTEVDETGELADEVTLARLRKSLAGLDPEQRQGLAAKWKQAGLSSMKEGAATLLVSQVPTAERLLAEQAEQQKDVYDRRRKFVLASLSEMGITDDAGRHEFIGKATNGATNSSKALTGAQVLAITEAIDDARREQGGLFDE